MKPLILRLLAERDIRNAFRYYLDQAPHIAQDFLNELDNAQQRILKHPNIGSPRYTHALDIPELRFYIVDRFPYLIFYIEQTTQIDVLRVLHQRQDIPNEFGLD